MMEENKTPAGGWAIYASGPDQESLDAQVQRIREAAPGMGLTHEPAMSWGDIVPGTGADQPERDDMLQSAGSGQFAYLLVVSPSQLSQDIKKLADICRRISLAGVVCHFLKPHPFDSSYGPVLMALQAVEEKRMFSERIRKGLKVAAREGRIPSGSAPYGYSYDPQTKTRTINPVEAPKVQEMFEMAAEGMTPGEIARSMNSQGLLTRSGGQWTGQGVRRILKNETLTGMVQFMGIRIKTVPIIGKALFDLVQRLLGQRRTKLTPRLTGMVRCGACERDNAYLVTVEDSSESIQIRLKPHVNPDGDGDGDGTPSATS